MTLIELLTMADKETIDDILQAAHKINKNWARYKDETIIKKLCNDGIRAGYEEVSMFLSELRKPEKFAHVRFKVPFSTAMVPALTLVIRDGYFYNRMVDKQIKLVEKLLMGGADPHETCEIEGWTPMKFAKNLNDSDIINMLENQERNLNALDDDRNQRTVS